MFWSSGKRQHWPPKSKEIPPNIGRYLSFNSNHPPHVKRGLIQSLHNKASTICQERQDLVKEISSLRNDLQFDGYLKVSLARSLIPRVTEQKLLGSVYVPYVKAVS
jgi:hypothetical protein